MKGTMRVSRTAIAIVGALLLSVGTAFAAGAGKAKPESNGKGTLHLYESLDVQGKQLQPGDYKLEWNGTGDKVEVNIRSGKETVATVPAKVVPTERKLDSDGYTASKDQDGKNKLSQVFFHGKDYRLELEPQGPSQNGATGNN
jgi:hypothetical protein